MIEFQHAFDRELEENGEMVFNAGLSWPEQARILGHDGAAGLTDGPFPQGKEFLIGFWIIACDSPERAYTIAAKASSSRGSGGVPMCIPIEVRPVAGPPQVDPERRWPQGAVTHSPSCPPPREIGSARAVANLMEEPLMSGTKTHITGVRTVSVQVEDQDAALAFYVDILGFTKLRDNPTPGGGRWIELAPGDDNVIITLEPAPAGTSRGAISIRFSTTDAQAAHAALRDAGVDTDEILRWPGVPPMFAFRDPDGNAFSITELA